MVGFRVLDPKPMIWEGSGLRVKGSYSYSGSKAGWRNSAANCAANPGSSFGYESNHKTKLLIGI